MVRPATIPEMAKAARLELVGVVGAKDPIAHLGGCLNVSRLLTLASINQEDDGNLVEDDMEAAQELIGSTQDELMNSGVIAALVLYMVFFPAYEEAETLTTIRDSLEGAGSVGVDDVTSMIATMLSVSMSSFTLAASSILYMQMTCWMTTPRAKLWYVINASRVTNAIDTCKDGTVFLASLALACECSSTGSAIDLLPGIPVIALVASIFYVKLHLARRSRDSLAAELSLAFQKLSSSGRWEEMPVEALAGKLRARVQREGSAELTASSPAPTTDAAAPDKTEEAVERARTPPPADLPAPERASGEVTAEEGARGSGWLTKMRWSALVDLAFSAKGIYGSVSEPDPAPEVADRRTIAPPEPALALTSEEPGWVPNNERRGCNICQKKFGLLRRKHHCRLCGEVICGDCSGWRVKARSGLAGSSEAVRACKTCATAPADPTA